MTPENQRAAVKFLHTADRRMGIGGPTPTTFATGYLYAGMGYTTVVEAAVPVLSAKHTHEELRDTPIIDKACCLLMANNELVLDLLEVGEYERAKDVVAWMISAAKVYGVKAVNPGGVTAWKWGKDAKQMHEPVLGYNKVTPGVIVSNLARMCDELGLPHPMHLHCNNLGTPGNVATTLETMKLLEGSRAPHGSLAVSFLRRRRLAHDAQRSGAARRVFQRSPQSDVRRRRRAVWRCRHDHGRRTVAAPALPAHGPQVGQPRRRERNRLRHRPLHLQRQQPGERRAVGRRAGTAAC